MARRSMAEVLEENERLWAENEHLRSRIDWQGEDEDDEDDEDEEDGEDEEDQRARLAAASGPRDIAQLMDDLATIEKREG